MINVVAVQMMKWTMQRKRKCSNQRTMNSPCLIFMLILKGELFRHSNRLFSLHVVDGHLPILQVSFSHKKMNKKILCVKLLRWYDANKHKVANFLIIV